MYQASEDRGPAVYTNSKPLPQPEAVPRTLSIKVIAYASAIIIVCLFLAITAANLILTKGHYQEVTREDTSTSLTSEAKTIETQLAVFNQIVQHMAEQPATVNILIQDNIQASQAWALQMRRFLPQASGVALLTSDGGILGQPAGGKITPECLTDMAKISQHETIMRPPVHQHDASTSHFDLTAPVKDQTNHVLGLLFVSFDLSILKPLIDMSDIDNSRLTLTDGYGNTMVRWDRLKNPSHVQKSRVAIAGSDWTLNLLEASKNSLASFLSLAIFNISAILLTVGVIAFLVRFMMRAMGMDFQQVKTLLNSLAEGQPLEEELPTPRLRETAEVYPAISHIHKTIDKKQQLLEHQELRDKLTGLSNRRQFNIEFARAYDFARRGTPVCVVLMHLSGLDALNPSQVGQVVKILGKTLKEHARRVDHAARLDQADFALLMFGASPEGTTPCLERICRSFRKYQVEHPAIPEKLACSLNCGYTRIHAHRDSNAAQVLKRAETALAEAKQSPDHHIISA